MAAVNFRFPLALGALMAAVSALSKPAAKGLEALTGMGLAAPAAALVLHIAPVLLCMAMVAAAQALSAKAGKFAGIIALAVAGFFFGMACAFMLDVFAGVAGSLTAWIGPMRPPGPVEIAGAALAGLFLVMAVTVAGVWLIGTPAAQTLNPKCDDPEANEVAASERPAFGLSAAGLLGYGLMFAALTLAALSPREAPTATLFGLLAAACMGFALALWPSWLIWAGADELMRRKILDSYGLSGVAAMIVLFGWTMAELASLAAPLTAYGAFLVVVAAQSVAALAAGSASGALLAAAPKAKAA